ncbi:MAG: ABC transporter ATP-binding protein [Acidobacteria bacterium]|nr:ABC transporter ATP-binding protein [Acidobacteriota bacterium]
MSFIELRNIRKIYRTPKTERHVLEGVNLTVDEGEFVSIVGYTGSGKTTLLGIASGLIPPNAGRITIGGRTVEGFYPEAGIVFQNYSLLPWFSALENVCLAVGAAFPGWPATRRLRQATRYLEMVNLGNAMHKRPSQLSGGMRQRVAIARAFAVEPRVLFLDEPFGALDALTRVNLQQELHQLCLQAERPVTVFMITNNVDEAILLSDRIVPMTRGPRATLGPGIPVPLPRPRTASLLLHDERAVRIHSSVVRLLTGFAHDGNLPVHHASSPARASRTRPAEAEA